MKFGVWGLGFEIKGLILPWAANISIASLTETPPPPPPEIGTRDIKRPGEGGLFVRVTFAAAFIRGLGLVFRTVLGLLGMAIMREGVRGAGGGIGTIC